MGKIVLLCFLLYSSAYASPSYQYLVGIGWIFLLGWVLFGSSKKDPPQKKKRRFYLDEDDD